MHAAEDLPPDFDVWDLARSVNPYPTYHRLRAHSPIHFVADRSYWLLTRYADIAAVLRDNRFGFPEPGKPLPPWSALTSAPTSKGNWPLLRHKVRELHHMVILLRNPPSHTRLRGLVQLFFNTTAIARWRPLIQELANSLIDQREQAGEMDLLNDFAGPLNSIMSAHMLQLPLDDRSRLEQWSRELSHLFDPDPAPADDLRLTMGGIRMAEYLQNVIEEREKQVGDDLISTLIRDRSLGKLSDDELLAMCMVLSFGGILNTRHLIGNGMLALLRHRDQWQMLQREPGLISSTVEEILRYDTTGQVAGRIALTDAQIGDTPIAKGQWVYGLLGAANRDPGRFSEPDHFDITRSPNSHLAFGAGIHHCLGAPLARVIAEIAVSTLVRRLPQIALTDTEPEADDAFHIHGLKSLRVVF